MDPLTVFLCVMAFIFSRQGLAIILNHANVDCRQYLDLLDYEEWKAAEALRLEMQRLTGKRIPPYHFFESMRQLLHLDLIERQDTAEPVAGWAAEFRRRTKARIIRPRPPGPGQHPLHV